MVKILIYCVCTLGFISCAPRYKVKVVRVAQDQNIYVPMQKTKSLEWQEGTPVYSLTETNWQIREWQLQNSFKKQHRKPRYIKIKAKL